MPRKQIWTLFIPIVLETLFMMLAGTVDTMMLSSVSNAAVGAVGTANSYINLFIIMFGIISSSLVAVVTQYIGAAKMHAAGQSLLIGLGFNAAAGLVLSGVMFFAGDSILRFAGVADGLFPFALIYLRIVGGSCFLNAMISVLSAYLRSFGFTKHSLLTTFASNIVNLVLNAVFLFRMELGVAGVAAATVISRLINLIAIAVIVRLKIHAEDGSEPVRYRDILMQMIRIGLPAALETALYNAATAFTVRFLNQMDSEGINMTARTYTQQITNLSFCSAAALAQANGIITGWQVGAKDFAACNVQTRRADRIAVLMGVSTAAVFALTARPILRFFTDDGVIIDLAAKLLTIDIALELGRAVNMVYGQALKISGDSIYPSVIGAVFMYLLMVGGTWYFGIHLHMMAVGAFIGMSLDECVRAVFLYGRWRSGRWKTKGILQKAAFPQKRA